MWMKDEVKRGKGVHNDSGVDIEVGGTDSDVDSPCRRILAEGVKRVGQRSVWATRHSSVSNDGAYRL